MEVYVAIGLAIGSFAFGGILGWLLGQRSGTSAVARVQSLESEIAFLKEERQPLQAERDTLNSKLQAMSGDLAGTRERETNLSNRLIEQEARLKDIHDRNRVEFENISKRLTESATGVLTTSSRTQLQEILNPLKQRLGEFESRMQEAFRKDADDTISLKAQIEATMNMSKSLGEKADGLAKALRGDVRMSGRWGELVLERILEMSHLEEGREFIRQGIGMGLENEEGDRLKPDILVRLPRDSYVIIDSKLPLKHYDAFCNAATDGERKQSRAAFVGAVETHIQALSKKQYQDNNKIVTHDLVLMFIPIEAALSIALLNENDLVEKAWRQQVVLVGPSTLLMTLKTVASIWKVQRQADSHKDIAKAGRLLYKRLRLFVEALLEVGGSLEGATSSYKRALSRLSTGKGNALQTAKRLGQLGGHDSQPIPEIDAIELVDEDDDEFDDEEEASGDAPSGAATPS